MARKAPSGSIIPKKEKGTAKNRTKNPLGEFFAMVEKTILQ
jgi:hypothetical protein